MVIEDLQNKITDLEAELRFKGDIGFADSTNTNLLIKSLSNDIEQLNNTKHELNQQIVSLKDKNWRDSLTIRQVTNELENLKRENSNLKSTIELIRDNEKDMKAENKFLRNSILAHERNSLLYQNIITQNDALDINVIQGLERSMYLLRSNDDVNKGLSLINIEKIVDEVRNFRVKTKAKVEAR